MPDLVNNGSYFGQTGGTQPQRSGFVRRATKGFSASVGALYPFFFDEVLPTDQFDIDTAMTAVLQPSIFPTADQIVADIHYFYAPYRILWENTKKFFGDVDPGDYDESTKMVMPYFLTAGTGSSSSAVVNPGSVLDYLGVDPGCLVDYFNVLPYRMYRMIWNEWYRNTAYQNPVLINKGDVETEYIPYLLHVNRFKDYFSSALPYPQITEDSASIGISGIAQVLPSTSFSGQPDVDTYATFFPYTYNGTPTSTSGPLHYNSGGPSSGAISFSSVEENYSSNLGLVPTNLGVDFDNQLNAVGSTVTALRSAVALQKFLEVEARGGRRYREMLMAHFSSILPDSTAQVPEFIGGARFNISMTSNVMTGANSGDQVLGSLSGVSITRDRSFKTIPHSFPEHGIIMGLISFRVLNHSYMQGTPRFFFKRSKDDLYWPEFEGISEQPIYRGEIYMGSGANSLNPNNVGNPALDVWGYNEYGAEYRYLPSTVAGQMRRSGFNNSFTPWTYADYYTQAPTLSASWLTEPRENVDNTLVYPGGTLVAPRPAGLDPVYYWNYLDADDPREQLTDQFMVQVGINMYCQRPMPLVSVPGIGGVL